MPQIGSYDNYADYRPYGMVQASGSVVVPAAPSKPKKPVEKMSLDELNKELDDITKDKYSVFASGLGFGIDFGSTSRVGVTSYGIIPVCYGT